MNWKKEVASLTKKSKEPCVQLDLDKGTVKYSNKIKLWRELETITGDEEVVRAFLINRLINELDYSADLIEIERPYEAGRPKKITPRIDVILKDSKGNAFFFIEAKAPNKFESDKVNIDGQLFKLASLHKGATGKKVDYLVYYTLEEQNGTILDKAIIVDYSEYKTYQAWLDAGEPSIGNELPNQYNKPQKEPLRRGGRRDLTTNFTLEEIKSLATNLHNVLWGGGGTGDTEIFASLVNVILAKIQDEYDTDNDEAYKFQLFQYGNELEKREVLFGRINELYRKALKDQLYIMDDVTDQYVINRQKFPLNKLVYAVGQLEKYSFVDGKSSLNGKDILGDFFEQIQREGFKQTKGQFFTPVNIVRFILYALELDNLAIKRLNEDRELPYIIDPACGSATFLIEAMKIVTQELKYRRKTEIKSGRQVRDRFEELFTPDNKEHRWARTYLYGIEHNFDLATASKVNMILHGDGATNIFKKDGLKPFRFYDKPTAPNYLNISHPDRLYADKETNGKFDVVVSNPPFSVNLDDETKRFLDNEFLFGKKKNSENLFIERYYQLLKDSGRFGVVLPESVYDTTENKYIRLFLYKYFYIRAVISIPQLTFEPYTQTKTSLLFAQKKPIEEVEKWNTLWARYSAEYEKLKTRVKNYVKVFLDGEKKDKYPSIKDDTDKVIRENLSRFLKIKLDKEDEKTDVKALIEEHLDAIEETATIDKDAAEIFGYVNVTWVFGEVAGKCDYPIFMAEAENVGYKRSKRGEHPQPNDLFDVEVAPNKINFSEVWEQYEAQIEELTDKFKKANEQLAALNVKDKKTKSGEKSIDQLEIQINRIAEQLSALKAESAYIREELPKYYDGKGNLREEYSSRTDSKLLNLFSLDRLMKYRSDYVLIREAKHRTILDHMRLTGIWQ